MVSLGFPFSFPQPHRRPPKSNAFTSFPTSVTASLAAAVTAGIGAGLIVSHEWRNPTDPFLQKALHFFSPKQCGGFSLWASLSLADNSGGTAVEFKTGVSFPTLLKDTQRLLGIGMRKKSIMGLQNIDVYAFGIYADDQEIKNLVAEKFGKFLVSELKKNKDFYAQIHYNDLSMTVRLQIVYGSLNIRSVRNAFEESVGIRLKKFSGSDNKELLQRFTSQFKDEYKLPRGSIIDISRERGHTLRTTKMNLDNPLHSLQWKGHRIFAQVKMKMQNPIMLTIVSTAEQLESGIITGHIDGKEVGSIQSKLLCQAILDLYMGEDPFDRRAKEEIELRLASMLQ